MQASRQPGPEQVVGTGANGWGGPWGLTRLQSPQRPHRHYSHDSGGEGQQAPAAELALGFCALASPHPSPPPPRPWHQPGYSSCRSEAWSLQENTGPPEPGFSVMF